VKTKYIVLGAAILVVLAGAAVFYFLFAGGRGGNALASVNGEKITVDYFRQEVEKVEEPVKGMIKENPAEFLEMMIMKALVLQEAKKEGFHPGKEENGEEKAIQGLMQKRFPSPAAVSKEELGEFYEMYKDRLEGKSLEEMAPMIEQLIQQQKMEQEYMRFLQEIRERAAVEINKEHLQALTAKTADIPTNTEEELATALKSGKPVLVDFGANTCMPCRQLRPILDEIKKEQAGKLEVLVLDVYKHQTLAGEYRIQVIPTLVFFDSSGKEMFRQQGFMPKAALMTELNKIGVS
jgi:thioredoxin 1